MAPRRMSKQRPAISEEQRESQMISRAMDLAEKQILEGTASAQVITHYLKLGSSREKLEQARLHRENVLLEARVEFMESAKRVEEMYAEAMIAMKSYRGEDPLELEGHYEDR